MRPHQAVIAHCRYLRSHINAPRVVVTTGLIVVSMLQYLGMHEHALAASIATNLIWIWE